MSFKETDCYIPRIWCGEKGTYPKGYKDDGYYNKVGTRYECLKQGIGVGISSTKKKHLPRNSLQQIKYIGEKHEEHFINAGINTIDELLREMGRKTSQQIKDTLHTILGKRNGKKVVLDTKAYNSVLLYLYRHGVVNVPVCKKM
jgi:hypothetical protein